MTTATKDRAEGATEVTVTPYVRTNPYLDAVKRAKRKPGKPGFLLNGDYSVVPYEGRKNANEAYTVMARLHQAGRDLGVDLRVRREMNDDGKTCKIKFYVIPVEKPAAKPKPAAKRAPRKAADKVA
jgi:hypothetical protein